MKNEQVTKQDFESLKNELLDKLLDKETYKRNLEKLVTKDLLHSECYKIRKDISDCKEELCKKLDRLLSLINGLIKQVANNQIDKAASEANFQRHERWLEDHDARLEWLERKTN